MTPKQIREIAEAMRDCGITHLKTGTLEMTCQAPVRASSAPELAKETKPAPVASMYPLVQPKETSIEAGPPLEEEKVPHQVHELTSLLRLSDIELVDQLFPEPKAPDEESA